MFGRNEEMLKHVVKPFKTIKLNFYLPSTSHKQKYPDDNKIFLNNAFININYRI